MITLLYNHGWTEIGYGFQGIHEGVQDYCLTRRSVSNSTT